MAHTLSWLRRFALALTYRGGRNTTYDMATGVAALLIVLHFGPGGLRMVEIAPKLQMAALAELSTKSNLVAMGLHGYREGATLAGGYEADATMEDMMTTLWVFKNRYLTGFHQKGHPEPHSYIDVVWEKDQASWTRWGYVDKFRVKPCNYLRFGKALLAAWHVMNDTPQGLEAKRKVGAADHYFNPQMASPKWARGMEAIGEYGHHLFKLDTTRESYWSRTVEAYYWVLTRQPHLDQVAMN